jgi:hypothetical protein
MASYLDIDLKMPRGLSRAEARLEERVVPYLQQVWIADYLLHALQHEIVAVELDRYSYLYDTLERRLIAAWTISRGPVAHERDKSRMKSHPLTRAPGFHRGHVIPHQLGGLCDINLVNQRGSLNIGKFRRLEILAVANPGALYFTYWQYASSNQDTPAFVDQGVLIPGQPADIVTHAN